MQVLLLGLLPPPKSPECQDLAPREERILDSKCTDVWRELGFGTQGAQVSQEHKRNVRLKATILLRKTRIWDVRCTNFGRNVWVWGSHCTHFSRELEFGTQGAHVYPEKT